MPVAAAVHGTFFCFAAAVLLVFVSVSVPVWDKISFLDVDFSTNGSNFTIQYGVFGYTGSEAHIGYEFPQTITTNYPIYNNLTDAFILHPIAAGLSGISVLFGVCGAGYSRAGSVLMTLCSALACITTVVVWVIDIVLFTLVRRRFNDLGENVSANYGNALWLTLGAMVALLLGFCTAACGICSSRSRRDGGSPNVWWRSGKFVTNSRSAKRETGTGVPIV